MKKKNNKKEIIFFCICFITLLAICYMIPYTHDDWTWASSEGINRLQCFFRDYNGRYFSNLIVIILTRSRILRAIFFALTISSIIILISKIVKTKLTPYIAILLMLFIPIGILRQGIVWTSGFVNYTFPVALLLLYYYIVNDIFSKKEIKISNKLIIPLLLMGVAISLIIEHVTIYNVLLAIGIPLYIFIKQKKINWPLIFYSIGSIIGTVIMFTNGAYLNIFNNNDTYRTIEQSNIFKKVIDTYMVETKNFLVFDNTLINIFISICLLIIVYRFYLKNKGKISKILKTILNISTFNIIGFLIYTFWKKIGGGNIFIYDSYTLFFESIISILYLLSILSITYISLNDKTNKKKIIFTVCSILVLTGPLLIVTPVSSRNFMPIYVLYILIACELFADISIDIKLDITLPLKSAIVILTLCFLVIYGFNFKIEKEMEKYINNNLSESKIILPVYMNSYYYHGSIPYDEGFEMRYKDYYNIASDTDLEFIDYKIWYNKYYKNNNS